MPKAKNKNVKVSKQKNRSAKQNDMKKSFLTLAIPTVLVVFIFFNSGSQTSFTPDPISFEISFPTKSPPSDKPLATWAKSKTLDPKTGWQPIEKIIINEPEERLTEQQIPRNYAEFKTEKQQIFDQYDYLYSPSYLCAFSQSIDMLVLVAGAAWEFERREILRKTWAAAILHAQKRNIRLKNLDIKLAFYTSNPSLPPSEIPEKYSSVAIMDLLAEESKNFEDLIVENVAETYANLTIKTLDSFKWAKNFCPITKYVMHVDSDVYVQWLPILEHLKLKLQLGIDEQQRPTCLTQKYKNSKVKLGKGKYQKFLTDIEYNAPIYPTYCSGSAFMVESGIAFKMFEISLYTPFFNLEDVYIGILRNKLDVKEPVDIKYGKLNGIEVCQHLSNSKFHMGINYQSEIVEEKLIEAWERYKETSLFQNLL